MICIFPSFLGKKPLITAVHDLIPYFVSGYDKGFKYAIKRWSIKYCCYKSDYLIVPFRSTKEKIVEMFHIPPDKIFVIPYGVDHATYFPDSSIEKKKFRIAFLGEAKRAKGMDSVIKAFRIIKETLPEASLVLASQGNELEQMKTLAKENLPENSYEFVGFVSEGKMREFYNMADVFIYPSHYGFGLSALEAMACGTPVIVGATLDALDFIDDEELLVDPENSYSLAQKVLCLISNREKYKQKSEEGIKTAKKYSWIKMAKDYYIACLMASEKYK